MLPRGARLTSPNDFARTTKSGFRVASKSLVIYFYPTDEVIPARFGLIIGKSVGGSVLRHRLSRQLRHLIIEQVSFFPSGALVVVRGLSNLSKLSSQELREEFSGNIVKVLSKKVVVK